MKVLILSCNNGNGHNAVAKAVQERFNKRGDESEIVDVLSFISPAASKVIAYAHKVLYSRLSRFNDFTWKSVMKERESVNIETFPYTMLTLGVQVLCEYIVKNDYDAVLCTHIFAGLMLSTGVKSFGLTVKTGIVETDYMVSPGSEACDLDYHFVPTSEIANQLNELGVPKEKIVVSGIPVRTEIGVCIPKEEVRKKFNINPDKKHILVMCGSMGGGPMVSITHYLIRNLGEKAYITVVCGSDQVTYRQMVTAYGLRKNVKILHYVKNITELMDSADILITKPGGISITEAAVKGLPLVLINIAGGCEDYNCSYFVSNGAAMNGIKPSEAGAICRNLMASDTIRSSMSERLKVIADENNTDLICEKMGENNAS